MGKDVVVLGRKDRPWREAMDQTEKELRISLSCGNKPWGSHPQSKASLFVQLSTQMVLNAAFVRAKSPTGMNQAARG